MLWLYTIDFWLLCLMGIGLILALGMSRMLLTRYTVAVITRDRPELRNNAFVDGSWNVHRGMRFERRSLRSRATRWLLGAWVFIGCGTTQSTQFRVEPGPARRSEATEPDSLSLPGFELDSSLVTRDAYDACVRLGVCEAATIGGRKEGPDQPMTSVTWEQANRYCAWQGKRLPTSRELERVREVHPTALQLDRDEWVDGWYTYYGRDFLPQVVSSGLIANTRLVHGKQYYGGPLWGHPRIGFRCSRWLRSPTCRGKPSSRR